MSQFEPGQRVEIFVVGVGARGRWVPATLLPRGGMSVDDQWTFRLSDGHEGFSVERWIRPPHALIQLAEAGQD